MFFLIILEHYTAFNIVSPVDAHITFHSLQLCNDLLITVFPDRICIAIC